MFFLFLPDDPRVLVQQLPPLQFARTPRINSDSLITDADGCEVLGVFSSKLKYCLSFLLIYPGSDFSDILLHFHFESQSGLRCD